LLLLPEEEDEMHGDSLRISMPRVLRIVEAFTAIAVTLFITASCLARAEETAKDGKLMDEAIWPALVEMLDAAPDWTRMQRGATESKRELLSVLEEIARQGVDNARAVVEEYARRASEAPGKMDVDELGNVFILNRVLFRVPARVRAEKARFFGGWAGVPHGGGYVDMLWPLVLENGQLRLEGEFRGYYGDVYDALGEFDYFLSEYGVRSPSG